jgi:trehalose-6-phosphatase
VLFGGSRSNPHNPFNPPRTIFLGENTTDEMAFTIIGTTRKTKPEPGTDFLNYFEKLLEVQAMKKLLGIKY